MTTLMQHDKIITSHPKSQAEMIDDQINKLCADTGLIKKRLLESIGIYQELYASRMKHQGLSKKESTALVSLVREKGKELERYAPGSNPVLTIDQIHERFHIWKTRLVQPIGTSYRTLERRKQMTPQQRQALRSELKKIAKRLQEFYL